MKHILTAALCLITMAAFSQDNVVDVIIDDKPAKLNITTGDYQFTGGTISQSIITNSSTSLSNNNVHTVSKGETLYSISKQYGVSIAQIKSVNNLKSNFLKVGQELEIGYSNNRIIHNSTSHSHIVIKGETLYRIATTNKMLVSELKRINGLESNIITVGQVLKLK